MLTALWCKFYCSEGWHLNFHPKSVCRDVTKILFFKIVPCKCTFKQCYFFLFQRVISRINQKKKIAMNCYTKSLNETPNPNTHMVQKCLQKLLRALHKDRHHTIQHFRHLLDISFEQVPQALLRCVTQTLAPVTDLFCLK